MVVQCLGVVAAIVVDGCRGGGVPVRYAWFQAQRHLYPELTFPGTHLVGSGTQVRACPSKAAAVAVAVVVWQCVAVAVVVWLWLCVSVCVSVWLWLCVYLWWLWPWLWL